MTNPTEPSGQERIGEVTGDLSGKGQEPYPDKEQTMGGEDRIKHRCTECGTESLCTSVEKLYSDRIECLKWGCDGEMKPVVKPGADR